MVTSNARGPGERPTLASWLSTGNSITQQFMAIGGRPEVVSLAGGLPASEIYPVEAIGAAQERALTRWGTQILEYGAIEGLPALRALAYSTYASRKATTR